MSKKFPVVSEKLLSVANFYSVLKNFQQCSFFELWLKIYFHQSHSTVSVSSFKLFFILTSLAIRDALARAVCQCETKPAVQCVRKCLATFMILSSFSGTMIQCIWKTDQ